MKRAPTGRCARCPFPPITADNSIGSLSNEFSWFQTSVFVIPGPPIRHSRSPNTSFPVPQYVIPAKAGIQAGWGLGQWGRHTTTPGFPLSRE